MKKSTLAGLITLFGSIMCSMGAWAAPVSVHVVDVNGDDVPDAVVYLEGGPAESKPNSAHTAEISQKDRQFVPLVTVVQVGTQVSFPNLDSVRHHVYSFSPAKTFDLPLYAGKTAAAQLFDKVGTVVLGCNIHDRMIAYVQVVDTPWFAKTDAKGRATIDGVVAGSYSGKVWYYGMLPVDHVDKQAVAVGDEATTVNFKLNVKRKLPDKSKDHFNNSDY